MPGLRLSMALGVAALVATTAIARATTVEVKQGTVSINTGEGYQKISKTTQVPPGTAVMASPGGIAVIVYDDGCRVQLTSKAVLVVSPGPACEARFQTPDHDYLLYGLAAGGVAAAAAVLAAGQGGDHPASP